MYFTFSCPSCGKKLKVREELAGRTVACPYCKSSITIPQPPSEEPEAEGEAALGLQLKTGVADHRGRKERRRAAVSGNAAGGTDVGLLTSGAIGLVAAVLFLLLLWPIRNFHLGELFLDRGWVPFALTFFMGWSVTILAMKSRKLRRQRGSMLFDLLPGELGADITPRNVDRFLAHIHALPVSPPESFLVNRVVRGLEHFRVRRSNPEVAGMLASQSEIDAQAVDSSYTLLKVFIWAIPILGFIGTVIGISGAVGGFSGSLDQAQDVSVLKESLNNVTGGLATAFDTTLIALVMSMLVMFPTSSLQKAEEDLLNWVDEYCNENLLKRLDDGGAGAAGERGDSPGAPTSMQQAIERALAGHHAELRVTLEQLRAAGGTVSAEVSRAWEEITRQQAVREREGAEQVERMRALAEGLQSSVASLERGLTGLADVLEKLGEQQVLVQQTPRRRWLFGGRG